MKTWDELHHDHARAVLQARDTLETLGARVARVLGPERAACCCVFAHDHHLDVPIPGIFQVEAYTRARLPRGELYVALNGEAYDRSYVLWVHARVGEHRPWILPMSRPERRDVWRLWREGWAAVEDAGLVLASHEERAALLVALLPECFADDVAALVHAAAESRGG